MKLTTKSKQAITAFCALALGGALLTGSPTMAKWFDSEPLNINNVTSGQLNITVAAPTLSVVGVLGGAPKTFTAGNIANYRAVPGDTATYTSGVTLNAAGDTLAAHLKVNTAGLVTGTQQSGVNASTATTEFYDAIKNSIITTVLKGATPITPTAGQYPVDLGLNQSYTVNVEVKFPLTKDGAVPAAEPANGTAGANWWAVMAQSQVANFTAVVLTATQKVS